MATTLQDAVLPRDPSSRHAFGALKAEPELRARRTLAEDILADYRAADAPASQTYELASRGGYARTVTGIVAYHDEEAETLMVRAPDGALARVPLRDVTAVRA